MISDAKGIATDLLSIFIFEGNGKYKYSDDEDNAIKFRNSLGIITFCESDP